MELAVADSNQKKEYKKHAMIFCYRYKNYG
jgi:hypothetical protein